PHLSAAVVVVDGEALRLRPCSADRALAALAFEQLVVLLGREAVGFFDHRAVLFRRCARSAGGRALAEVFEVPESLASGAPRGPLRRELLNRRCALAAQLLGHHREAATRLRDLVADREVAQRARRAPVAAGELRAAAAFLARLGGHQRAPRAYRHPGACWTFGQFRSC